MKLSRIDQIALNGATGEHYKYEDVAKKIAKLFYSHRKYEQLIKETIEILVESFPNGS